MFNTSLKASLKANVEAKSDAPERCVEEITDLQAEVDYWLNYYKE